MSNVAHAIDNSPLLKLLVEDLILGTADAAINAGIKGVADAGQGITAALGEALGDLNLGALGRNLSFSLATRGDEAAAVGLSAGAATMEQAMTHETVHAALPEGVMEVSFNDITAPTFPGAGHAGQSAGIGW